MEQDTKNDAPTTTWGVLSGIALNNKVERKGNLTYLSWAWAWGMVKGHFPDANYRVIERDGKPYLYDEALGYMVNTKVTIAGETMPMHLPVMDNKNRAMKALPYASPAYDKYKKKWTEETVQAATMMEINKAIMRCLAKNLAMFGLGHYIYAGEDLPTSDATTPEKEKPASDAKPVDKPVKKTEVKAVELPAYPQSDFEDNQKAWAEAIKVKKTTPQILIAKMSTKGVLSDEQKQIIEGFAK